ncbi:hypothetical protein NM208_g13038 [Fusarium decemcellulare]|uniref:Uncharacterized protein n=1 Tax=Fusarium decemcellulare TaxID=57161 RepID=A0ACC1RNB7_9HYPO|nr:hypothetical protein NM208_g13038 [Fusarium decemcellulare]
MTEFAPEDQGAVAAAPDTLTYDRISQDQNTAGREPNSRIARPYFDENPTPTIRERTIGEARFAVGQFGVTLPLSDAQKKNGEQQKPERMRDEKHQHVNPKYVLLWPELTQATAKAKAIAQYDDCERSRVMDHNIKCIVACARRRIKKWAVVGTVNPPRVDECDRARNLQRLVFATPFVDSMIQGTIPHHLA